MRLCKSPSSLIILLNIYTDCCILQVKGLVKQHIDSFNYFINVDVSIVHNLCVLLEKLLVNCSLTLYIYIVHNYKVCDITRDGDVIKIGLRLN